MFAKYVQQGVTLYDMMAWGKNRCAEGMGGRNAVNSGRHPTVYQKTISNINCALKLEDIHDVLKRVNNQYFYLVLRFVKRLRGGIVWICQQGMFLGATKKTEKNHGVVSVHGFRSLPKLIGFRLCITWVPSAVTAALSWPAPRWFFPRGVFMRLSVATTVASDEWSRDAKCTLGAVRR